MALAERGPVVAFELDDERALYAEWNTGVPIRRENALSVDWNWNMRSVTLRAAKQVNVFRPRTSTRPTRSKWLAGWQASASGGREAAAFVFDADPAAVRAHALGTLCATYDLHPLADSVGYLTGKQPVPSPWLRGYRVLSDAPARERAVRSAVRELVGRVVAVKSRVRDTERFGWVAKVVEGKRPITAMLYPCGRSVRVLLVEPL